MEAIYSNKFRINITQHLGALKNYGLQLTSNNERANDLAQETVLKAIRYENQFEKGTNLKGWLFTIMKNTFINDYRRNIKRNTFLDSSDNSFFINSSTVKVSNGGELRFIREDLENAIERLPKDIKYVFTKNMEGYKYHEIAEELNIPIGTVKTRIFMARKMLKKMLWEYKSYLGLKTKA